MATKELISTVTVGAGGAASITFSSIPQNYTDLVLVVSGRTDRPSTAFGDTANIAFNGSTASFSNRLIEGNGSSAYSEVGTRAIGYLPAGVATANTFGNISLTIPNYTASTNKAYSADSVHENNASSGISDLFAGFWSSTAAITSISLTSNTGYNFVQYSTAYLYGFRKGSDGITTVA